MEKRLKEIQGRAASPLVRVCVHVCVMYFGERRWVFLATNETFSLDAPTLQKTIHPLSLLSGARSPVSVSLSIAFVRPAARPPCEIHHVLTPHYSRHIFRQRDDESLHSPLSLPGSHGDALRDGL